MEGKKLLFILPVGLALLLCTSVLVGSASPVAYGQQQPNSGGNQNMTPTTNTGNNTSTSTGGTLDCDSAASVLRGMRIQNPAGVCDIAVPLQGVQVQDTATGASLNNLLIMNPLFEFVPVSNQATGSSSATTTTTGGNQTTVYGFAEFALMGGQLPSAMRMLANSSWNVVAVHNHVIGESPSMIFVHAIANGDINTLAQDTRTILDAVMTQMQSSSGNQTSTTAGGGGGGGAGNTNGTATGSGITGGDMTSNSSPSSSSLTGGTPTGNGSTAGGGVGTFGGGGGTTPSPDASPSDGSGSGDGTTTGGTPTGGAAGPQVMP
jgi:uncharacterized protein DUF1259